jgi:DNA-binding MarR family transcriptional regulator
MPSATLATVELPPLGKELEFLRLLWAVDHGLNRMSKRMEAKYGVTGPQRLAIRFIGRFPGISAGKLASILHMHPSTLTGILRRLERGKLVIRHADPRDGRRLMLMLSAKGRRRDADEHGTIEAVVRATLSKSTAQQIEATARVLASLARALEPDPARREKLASR